jgi:hypothetical protein
VLSKFASVTSQQVQQVWLFEFQCL